MANYFVLTLDTTAPEIIINAPSTVYEELVFTVEANEELDTYQNIYIIDAEGTRHDLILLYDDTSFYGTVNLSDYPEGVMTIYAQVRDKLFNKSVLASKQIVKTSSVLKFKTFNVEKIINIKTQVKEQIKFKIRF